MRLLAGVLVVLVVALAGLSVRAWQVFHTSDAALGGDGAAAIETSPGSEQPPTTPASAAPVRPVAPVAPVTPVAPSSPASRRAAPTSPPASSTPPAPAATRSLRGVVIALDPGHNGENYQHRREIGRRVDAGGFSKECNTTGTASDDGYAEATFTWELAQRLAALLTAQGAEVRMTRSSNTGWGPCIDARGRFGAAVRARVALSLHADGAAPSDHGFHVIAPGLKPGYTDDILPASQRLAVALRDSVVAAGFAPSTYIGAGGLDTRSDLGTLNRADVPTAMIECGNLRNAADAATLRSAAGQSQLAKGLTAGITRYLAGPG